MHYYAIIDTNVIVSGLLNPFSIPGKILELSLKKDISIILNKEIFDEYHEVLNRNKFSLSKEKIKKVLDEIKLIAVWIDRAKTDISFIDKDDIVFYEVVLSARKYQEAYLVTGNKKHFPIRPYIVTPREMLDIIQKDK